MCYMTGIDVMKNSINDISLVRNLNVLKYILSKNKAVDYSILDKKEWKTCLQKDGDQWKVSFIERGQDVSPKLYDNVNDACLDVIQRTVPKCRQKKAKVEYQRKIIK